MVLLPRQALVSGNRKTTGDISPNGLQRDLKQRLARNADAPGASSSMQTNLTFHDLIWSLEFHKEETVLPRQALDVSGRGNVS
jgi:hypothetical protein